MRPDIREVVRRYTAEGRHCLPVNAGEKATRFPRWSEPDVRATEDDFAAESNVAWRLDAPLTDVDCDSEEARKLAPRFLLQTGLIHGRPSLGASHYWYEADGSSYFAFKDLD